MLTRLFSVSRPVLWINTIGPGVVGMWLTGTLWDSGAIALLIWLTLPFNLLIYGINDIFDRDTDQLNERKGGYGGARIVEGDVRLIWWGVVITNLPFLAWFATQYSAETLAWIAAYVLVFAFYSMPPLRFKARPYLDALSNAAYALPLAIVPLALGRGPVWLVVIAVMAWSIAKHTYDAIQDIAEDSAAGIRTTAVALGARGALAWAATWWLVASVCLGLVNVSIGIANAGYAAVLVWMLWREPSAARARWLYRFSVAYPYVVGSIAGSQLTLAIFFGWYAP
ncbi:MAG TPA: UbiA family prenyltransferase [Microbacteriaceae bacterium]|nr:UbiA family prenyltransferase [Microbacteriaceae bacterium]